MTDDDRMVMRVVSACLQFPDERLDAVLSATLTIAEVPSHSGMMKAIRDNFLPVLGSLPLVKLQEDYTRVFDMNPETSLNLTWHRFGNGRDRGQALMRLLESYRVAGFSPKARELPDYLPMMLEFIAVGPPEQGVRLLREYAGQFSQIALRLHHSGSPYAIVLDVLVSVAGTILKREGSLRATRGPSLVTS